MNKIRLATVVALTLCSSAATAADSKPKPIRIAAPGFTAVNVDDKVADFFSDHFAQQLSLQGIGVISANEVGALVGLERQKQLLGCSESSSSCVAELANAMGADGVITGSIGKFGSRLQANIKVLSANNGQALSIISRKAASEDELLDMLTEAAEVAAGDLRAKLRPGERAPEGGGDAGGSSSRGSSSGSSGSATVTSSGGNSGGSRPSAAAAAGYSGPTNALTVSPVGLAMGWYAVEYERAMGGGLTVFASPAFINPWWTRITAFEVTGGARYYLFGSPFSGLFLGVQLTLGAGSAVSTDPDTGITTQYGAIAVVPGVMAGFSVLIADRVPLSLGVGVGYDVVGSSYAFYYWASQVFTLTRLNIGFAF